MRGLVIEFCAFCLKQLRYNMPFYAVRTGRNPGIYNNWDTCRSEVNGYSKARYKKFDTQAQAQAFVNGFDNPGSSYDNSYSSSPPQSYGSQSYGSSQRSYGSSKRSYSSSFQNYSSSSCSPPSPHQYSPTPSYSQTYSKSSSKTYSAQPKRNKNLASIRRDLKSVKRQWSGPEVHQKRFKSASSSYQQNESDDHIDVYTDGACFGNGRKSSRAGIGVYWGPGHHMNVSEKLPGRQTNNRAEIRAACKALEQAKSMNKKNVTLNTDSQFMINSMTKWLPKWKSNGWKLSTGDSVVNRDDFEELDRQQKGINVKWVHVKGHSGNLGNEAADKLANAGARK